MSEPTPSPSDAVEELGSDGVDGGGDGGADGADGAGDGTVTGGADGGGDGGADGAGVVEALLSTEPRVDPDRVDLPPAAAHAYAGARKMLSGLGWTDDRGDASGTPAAAHFGMAAMEAFGDADADDADGDEREVSLS